MMSLPVWLPATSGMSLFRGVSILGDLFRGSLSKEVSVQGSLSGGFCPGGLCMETPVGVSCGYTDHHQG